jgi:hypothetical protein
MLEMIVGAVIFGAGLLLGAVFGQGFGEAKAYREMINRATNGTPIVELRGKVQ